MRQTPAYQGCRRMSPRPIHIDFQLDWIVQVAQLERATPCRRLNAIQNVLAALTQRWTGDQAEPAHEPVRVERRLELTERDAVQVRRALGGVEPHVDVVALDPRDLLDAQNPHPSTRLHD